MKAFEAHTSAELVITVKREARSYPEADLRVDVLFAFATLLFLLFYSIDFSTGGAARPR